MGEWHAVYHLRHSSDKLRSGRSVELSIRLRLNDTERQSLQLTHETLDLLCRAAGPGQRQVGRNRPAICNTNSLSEQVMPAGDDDVWILLRGWRGNGKERLCMCSGRTCQTRCGSPWKNCPLRVLAAARDKANHTTVSAPCSTLRSLSPIMWWNWGIDVETAGNM